MPPRVPDEQLGFARKLRSDMTAAEIAMWRIPRDRRIGAKFRRQVPVGPSIADFARVAIRLVLELDGTPRDATHRWMRDVARGAWFERQGWRVLRTMRRFFREAIPSCPASGSDRRIPSSDPR